MNTYAKISLKILVIINLVMVLPGLLGVCMSFALFSKMPFYGLVSLLSISAGIANASYLFRNIKTKIAWQYNLYLSIWAIVLWTIVYAIAGEGFWFTGYWALFIWPITMTACSLYVLDKEKRRLDVLLSVG